MISKIAAMTNQARDAHESTVSAKDKRKARKELEAARREYEAKMALLEAEEEGDAGKASVSNMVRAPGGTDDYLQILLRPDLHTIIFIPLC